MTAIPTARVIGRAASTPSSENNVSCRVMVLRISIGPLCEARYFAVHLDPREWITLHDNPNFHGFVDFLRTELDRVGPAHADLCRDFFSRAVALELSFFEAAYTS